MTKQEAAKRALRAGAMVLARDTRLAWKEPGRRPAEWAPLAAATVKRKGHADILVDTGHLKGSVALGEVTERQATVGPLSEISIYWRADSPKPGPSNTVMEVILTRDAGHLTRMSSLGSQPAAVPGILRVGLEGGACMLATNRFPYLWAQNYFDATRASVNDYALTLWEASKNVLGTGLGEELRIALAATENYGTAILPFQTLAVDNKAYGYVEVKRMSSGAFPELLVNLSRRQPPHHAVLGLGLRVG